MYALIRYSIEDSDEDGEVNEDEMDMDMDLESEEDDSPPKPIASSSKSLHRPAVAPGRNPYPLEGKYMDEDDRER